MTVKVTVSGQKAVLAALVRELGPKMTTKAAIGLRESAALVEMTAKGTVATHHWHGTTESKIHASVPKIHPDGSVTVEVASGSPAARVLEAGWYSRGGAQPPADALEAWVSSKGIQPQSGQTTKGLAFVIARSIGANSKGTGGRRYGFAMGALHYLKKSIQRKNKAAILEILIRAMRA